MREYIRKLFTLAGYRQQATVVPGGKGSEGYSLVVARLEVHRSHHASIDASHKLLGSAHIVAAEMWIDWEHSKVDIAGNSG